MAVFYFRLVPITWSINTKNGTFSSTFQRKKLERNVDCLTDRSIIDPATKEIFDYQDDKRHRKYISKKKLDTKP